MIKTPSRSASRPARSLRDRRGFALLITITLLAFLVLLLVSLASLTRVETQVASNNQQLATARQNALYGLNVALGQLQKFTGPDQRATSTADIQSTAVNGSKKWTGVWGNSLPGTDTSHTPVFLNWLVSGNESIDVTASAAAADFGRITSAAATPPVTPNLAVNNLTTNSTALSPDLEIATSPAAPARLLVGKNTLGSTATTADYVVAPVRNITVPAGSIPGQSGNTAVTIGRYAYWVGDEGVKAKYNVPIPEAVITAAPGSAANIALFQSAPRVGIEKISGFANYAAPGSYLATQTAPAFRAELAQTVSAAQLALSATGGFTATVTQPRFHDLTAASHGVLSDQRAGGLRKDLTRGLTAGAAVPSGQIMATGQTISAVSATASGETGFTAPANTPPTWDLLRSYYNLRATGAGLTPQVQTATQHGLHPLLVNLALNFYWERSPVNGNSRIGARPFVVLYNPYNTPLEAATYQVEVRYGTFNNFTLTYNDSPPTSQTFGIRNIFQDSTNETPSNATVAVRFRIPAAPFAPGEVRYFALNSDQVYPTYNNTAATVLSLSDYTGSPRAAYKDTSHIIPPTATSLRISTNFYPPSFYSFELYSTVELVLFNGTTRTVLQKADQTHFYQGGAPSVNPATATTFNFSGMSAQLKSVADTYNFQISPGNNGGARVLADLNIRAKYTTTVGAPTNWNRNPLWQTRNGITNAPPAQWIGTPGAGSTGAVNGSWGDASDGSGQAFVPLFDLPRADLSSLGQLQHVNFMPFAHTGSYSFGNSYANAFVTSGSIDTAYALNLALWDRYFFSTIPAGITAANIADSAYRLPSPRLRFAARDGNPPALSDALTQGYDNAAATLLISGAFNINSTSVEAWRAQLASLNGVPLQITDAETGAATTLTPPTVDPATDSAKLSAFTSPWPRTSVPGGDNTKPWRGLRTLTDGQITELASRIVDQIKTNGPFVSLAHFINRKLTDNDSGPLQRALDATPVTAANRINLPPDPATPGSSTASLLPITTVNGQSGSPTRDVFNNTPATQGKPRATLAPGWLSQADLLTALGPVISARSDTFIIRSYGETTNPLDDTVITGRAWCEAVVQRLPDYVDSVTNTAATAPDAASPDNKTFGRRYRVVSFRWLTPSDI